MIMSTTLKKDQTTQAKEAAGQAVDKAKDAASHVGEAAQHAAQAVGQTAENATAAVGQSVQKAAEGVREYGPHEGLLGSATQTVADTLESTGKYVEQKNLSGMVDDSAG
jgi:F0F1-type ATP synthase membrane subunit b/b'